MTDDDVGSALRDLGRRVHVPPPPDLTASVLTAPRRRNRWLAAIIGAVTAFAIAFAVSPAVRAGVVELLRFAGVEFRAEAPHDPAPPLSGREVSLDEARRQLPFEIHLPARLGTPDRVTVHEGRFVTLRYGGLRLDQFDGTVGPTLGKMVNGADVERIGEAVWIPRPHELFYLDRTGQWRREQPHGVGRTLIWQRGQVTMRLEGELTRERALEISAS